MRIEKIKEKMTASDLDALLITDMKNIYYLTGFSGTAGSLLLTKSQDYFLTDDRYIEFAKTVVQDMEIISTRQPFKEVGNLSSKLKRLAFEDSLDFASYQVLLAEVKSELHPTSNFLMEIRQIKDKSEIDIIRKACQITDEAFSAVLNFIEPGRQEIEVANFLDFKMRELGATGVSFESIVASGKRSALPHGVASHKMIEFGDAVTLDFGCFYQNYASDMTRTIFVGEVSSQMAEIYGVVKSANEALIEKASAGLSYAEVDKIPRDLITAAGFGENFSHGIGHGLGLDVHELPYFNQKMTDQFLEENMIITDEPGIYLPGLGGVRIEDDLLIKKQGCEVLTKSSKSLIVI